MHHHTRREPPCSRAAARTASLRNARVARRRARVASRDAHGRGPLCVKRRRKRDVTTTDRKTRRRIGPRHARHNYDHRRTHLVRALRPRRVVERASQASHRVRTLVCSYLFAFSGQRRLDLRRLNQTRSDGTSGEVAALIMCADFSHLTEPLNETRSAAWWWVVGGRPGACDT